MVIVVVKTAALSVVTFPIPACAGAAIGSGICPGPGTIVGGIIGGLVGVAQAFAFAYFSGNECDSGDESHEYYSNVPHEDYPNNFGPLGRHYYDNHSALTPTIYPIPPKLCGLCTEPGKGCYHCEYTGTIVHP